MNQKTNEQLEEMTNAPATPESFEVWRTIKYGGVPIKDLIKQIKESGRDITHEAEQLTDYMKDLPKEQVAHIVFSNIRSWFHDKPRPSREEVYSEAARRGLTKLHPLVGLHLAAEYPDQQDMRVWIGQEPIKDVHGRRYIFQLELHKGKKKLGSGLRKNPIIDSARDEMEAGLYFGDSIIFGAPEMMHKEEQQI